MWRQGFIGFYVLLLAALESEQTAVELIAEAKIQWESELLAHCRKSRQPNRSSGCALRPPLPPIPPSLHPHIPSPHPSVPSESHTCTHMHGEAEACGMRRHGVCLPVELRWHTACGTVGSLTAVE